MALSENEFVFPGICKSGHLVEVNRHLKAVEAKTNIKVVLHDLRRTFASIAESETSYMAVKTLLNHSLSADVTHGYIQVSMTDLRKAVEKISQRLMGLIKA